MSKGRKARMKLKKRNEIIFQFCFAVMFLNTYVLYYEKQIDLFFVIYGH